MLALLSLLCPATSASPPATRPAAPELLIRVDKSDWRGSELSDVRAVLRSAGAQILPLFPGVRIDPLRVSNPGGPIVLFDREPDGAIRVKLDTGHALWAQLAFQFAHELTHVLARFRPGANPNKWLEESFCETGSLFVLRRMGEAWRTAPPYPNWKGYAPKLTAYADERLKAHALPPGVTLAAWYAENEPALRKTATDRPRNTTVAIALLGLLEKSPEAWAAVHYLNEGRPDSKDEALADCLRRWHAHTPAAHRPFVRDVAALFGLSVGGTISAQ